MTLELYSTDIGKNIPFSTCPAMSLNGTPGASRWHVAFVFPAEFSAQVVLDRSKIQPAGGSDGPMQKLKGEET